MIAGYKSEIKIFILFIAVVNYIEHILSPETLLLIENIAKIEICIKFIISWHVT